VELVAGALFERVVAPFVDKLFGGHRILLRVFRKLRIIYYGFPG
jgi:hypothetical protein